VTVTAVRPPLLGAQLRGFPAFLFAPGIVRRVEELAADPRIPAERLAEARQFAAAAQSAAAEWVAWHQACSVDGTAEPDSAEPVRASAGDDLTTRQAAELLGVSPRWVRQLLDSGVLTGRLVGRVWVVDRSSVEQERDLRRTT
jgi:excisionase family DNA binding protein